MMVMTRMIQKVGRFEYQLHLGTIRVFEVEVLQTEKGLHSGQRVLQTPIMQSRYKYTYIHIYIHTQEIGNSYS